MTKYESFRGYPTADLDAKNLDEKIWGFFRDGLPIPFELFDEYAVFLHEELASQQALIDELQRTVESLNKELKKRHLDGDSEELILAEGSHSKLADVIPMHHKDNE